MKINWELFDPAQYIKDNYSYIHNEDRQILDILIPYYAGLPIVNSAIEVGVGPNLYPLMLMSTKVSHIEAIDPNPRSLLYLKKQLKNPDHNWQIFWEYISQSTSKVWSKDLKNKVKIMLGGIQDVGTEKYDLISANFVLESISSSMSVFRSMCSKLVTSIAPGGYCVATFMENSSGYSIGGIKFPAVKVNKSALLSIFKPILSNLKISRISRSKVVLRPGYTGMLVLTGQKI